MLAQYAHHHQARVHPHPYREPLLFIVDVACLELSHCLHDSQPRIHGPAGIVFMGLRIPKVDDQAIPLVLGNMSPKPVDDLGA
jgi:hypothetical protein